MTSTALSPVATRFAWKEYRTLRGFWIAASTIAVVLQSLSIALAPPSSDPVTTIFGIALAAAALYAVGVAATTFSMEHEEETYAYLSGLPTRWFPLFAGKASFALFSSLLLAAVLLLTAWLLAGMRAPNAAKMNELLATFGFAIVEMLAWGMFFSLLIRQPLLAALLAIGAESLAVTWAASIFGEQTAASMSLDSYANVIGPRVALVACLAAIDVLLARRWLVCDHPRNAAESIALNSSSSAVPSFRRLLRAVTAGIASFARHYSPRVFSHLLWQAWRQSWKPMLAMALIVPGLCVVLVLIADMWNLTNRIRFSSAIFFPYTIGLVAMAIYWSVVFYADQRQNKYRFLAEHAVWPRYVWFSRLLLWSLPILLLIVVGTIAAIATTFSFVEFFRRELELTFRNRWWNDSSYLAEQWHELDIAGRSLVFGLWGAALGATLGQATSLFFRRALVAGFAAIVFALPLFVWGAAAWTWELRPLIFLAPIALGLVAATWLRVPDWLTDRNSLAGWIKVLVAVALPFAFIAWRLPAARTISLEEQYQALAYLDGPFVVPNRRQSATSLPFHADQVVSHWVKQSTAEVTKEQQATVDRLVRLAEMIEYPQSSASQMGAEMGMGSMGGEFGGGEIEASREARQREDKYVEQTVNANRGILDEAVPLARRDYRLTLLDGGFGRIQGLYHWLKEAGRLAARDGKLYAALEYHLAALTLWERLWTGQSTNTYQTIENRLQAQRGLVEWASVKGQTSERIKRTIAALNTIYPPVTEFQSAPDSIYTMENWTPPPQIIATYEELRAIVVGEQPSRLLGKDANWGSYIAVMSNELPVERRRALTILDFLTIAQVAQWRDVVWRLNQQVLQDWSSDKVLESGERTNEDIGFSLRNKIQVVFGSYDYRYGHSSQPDGPPYAWLRTSPFLRSELQKNREFGEWLASVVDANVTAWGLRQQLALIAYKTDHGEYPETLAELVPEYLPFVPIDPFTGREFEYYPQGIRLDLRAYESIAAGTPLLWSAGADGQRLEATFVTEAEDPAADVSERQIRREVFQLRGHSWSSQSLVFPLPKLPADEGASLPDEP